MCTRSPLLCIFWIASVLLASGWREGLAHGQACVTCRTERCPQKENMNDWCGNGPDPLVTPAKPHPQLAPQKRFLALRIQSEPPGASVRIDGQLLPAPTPMQTLLKRGQHRIEASLAGYLLTEVSVNLLRGGQMISVSLPVISKPELAPPTFVEQTPPVRLEKPPDVEQEPPPAPLQEMRTTAGANGTQPESVAAAAGPPAPSRATVPAPSPRPLLSRPGRRLLVGGGTLAALGIAGIVSGAALYGADLAIFSQFIGTGNELDKVALLQRAQPLDTASIASYAIGSALLITGAALIGGGLYQAQRGRPAGRKWQVVLTPIFAGTGASARVLGRF